MTFFSKKSILGALALVTILLTGGLAVAQEKPAYDPENTLFLDLESGRVVIEMRPDLAPNHVARIKELVRKKFYDGVVFHRVIAGFMAQTGDPTGTGRGGSGKNLDPEFSSEAHVRGTVSMARAASPSSADSQFFIVFAPASHLDGQYTVWGKVIEGMDKVDNIKKGDPYSGAVTDPDKIVTVRVAADVEKEAAAVPVAAPTEVAVPAAEATSVAPAVDAAGDVEEGEAVSAEVPAGAEKAAVAPAEGEGEKEAEAPAAPAVAQ